MRISDWSSDVCSSDLCCLLSPCYWQHGGSGHHRLGHRQHNQPCRKHHSTSSRSALRAARSTSRSTRSAAEFSVNRTATRESAVYPQSPALRYGALLQRPAPCRGHGEEVTRSTDNRLPHGGFGVVRKEIGRAHV